MSPTGGGQPPRHRGNSFTVFAVLLFGGLAALIVGMIASPEVEAKQVVIPAVVGALMAAAVAIIVVRDRRERNAMPPSKRDSQDQGVPR